MSGFGLPMCVATNDHYWHGGSICSACGTRLRCGCGRFVREADLDRHFMGGECPTVPAPAPCWPGECDATCDECVALFDQEAVS